jgi:hypothetical protein
MRSLSDNISELEAVLEAKKYSVALVRTLNDTFKEFDRLREETYAYTHEYPSTEYVQVDVEGVSLEVPYHHMKGFVAEKYAQEMAQVESITTALKQIREILGGLDDSTE